MTPEEEARQEIDRLFGGCELASSGLQEPESGSCFGCCSAEGLSMNEPKKVTAAILRKGGKILIAKRRSGDAFEGKWEFPGGKIEKGETPEQCLRRELLEEFDIDTTIKKLLCIVPYTYKEGSILLYTYEVTQSEGDFKLNAHDEVKWAKIGDLDMYDFLEADKLIIEELSGETK